MISNDFSLDEKGLRSNLRHWIDDLEIDGFFISGKQGEFFSMSLEERKKSFLIAVEECDGKAQTIVSCSDQNFDTVMELAKYAEKMVWRFWVPKRDAQKMIKKVAKIKVANYQTPSQGGPL